MRVQRAEEQREGLLTLARGKLVAIVQRVLIERRVQADHAEVVHERAAIIEAIERDLEIVLKTTVDLPPIDAADADSAERTQQHVPIAIALEHVKQRLIAAERAAGGEQPVEELYLREFDAVRERRVAKPRAAGEDRRVGVSRRKAIATIRQSLFIVLDDASHSCAVLSVAIND